MCVCLTQRPAPGLLTWVKGGPCGAHTRLREAALGRGVSQRGLREQAFFERLGEWGGAGPEGGSQYKGFCLQSQACTWPAPPKHPPGRGAQASDQELSAQGSHLPRSGAGSEGPGRHRVAGLGTRSPAVQSAGARAPCSSFLLRPRGAGVPGRIPWRPQRRQRLAHLPSPENCCTPLPPLKPQTWEQLSSRKSHKHPAPSAPGGQGFNPLLPAREVAEVSEWEGGRGGAQGRGWPGQGCEFAPSTLAQGSSLSLCLP